MFLTLVKDKHYQAHDLMHHRLFLSVMYHYFVLKLVAFASNDLATANKQNTSCGYITIIVLK